MSRRYGFHVTIRAPGKPGSLGLDFAGYSAHWTARSASDALRLAEEMHPQLFSKRGRYVVTVERYRHGDPAP